MKDKLKVLIVGAGNIASLFDKKLCSQSKPLTHTGAYLRNGCFEIVACVERDLERRKAFLQTWNIQHGFENIADINKEKFQFDVISICTNTSSHYLDINQAIKLTPKLIFSEKPITPSYSDSQSIVDICRASEILLAVNYSRRWDPEVMELKRKLIAGLLGRIHSVVGIYNKGILNNGTHLFDLIELLFGKINLIATGKAVYDYSANDPSVPALLESLSGVPINIAIGDSRDYSIFELHIYLSSGVISMEMGGQKWRIRKVVDSIRFEGYKEPSKINSFMGTQDAVMLNAVENIRTAIVDQEALLSTGETALASQWISEKIMSNLNKD